MRLLRTRLVVMMRSCRMMMVAVVMVTSVMLLSSMVVVWILRQHMYLRAENALLPGLVYLLLIFIFNSELGQFSFKILRIDAEIQ